jgi:hypothetical protein
MTASESACAAVRAKSSLTSRPLSPYFWKRNRLGNPPPVFRSVVSDTGSGWRA